MSGLSGQPEWSSTEGGQTLRFTRQVPVSAPVDRGWEFGGPALGIVAACVGGQAKLVDGLPRFVKQSLAPSAFSSRSLGNSDRDHAEGDLRSERWAGRETAPTTDRETAHNCIGRHRPRATAQNRMQTFPQQRVQTAGMNPAARLRVRRGELRTSSRRRCRSVPRRRGWRRGGSGFE
jgi:hypothetical protein